jgi:hypothetical protein
VSSTDLSRHFEKLLKHSAAMPTLPSRTGDSNVFLGGLVGHMVYVTIPQPCHVAWKQSQIKHKQRRTSSIKQSSLLVLGQGHSLGTTFIQWVLISHTDTHPGSEATSDLGSLSSQHPSSCHSGHYVSMVPNTPPTSVGALCASSP